MSKFVFNLYINVKLGVIFHEPVPRFRYAKTYRFQLIAKSLYNV